LKERFVFLDGLEQIGYLTNGLSPKDRNNIHESSDVSDIWRVKKMINAQKRKYFSTYSGVAPQYRGVS
jgi:hypothetical protein